MTSIFKKLIKLPKKQKDRSRLSSPAPSAGRPSTSRTPGESAINLNLFSTPVMKRPSDSLGEKKRLYLAAGIPALKHLKEISEASDLLAPLKAACGATTVILETIETMDSNKEAWQGALQAIQRHQRTFEQQLADMSVQSIPKHAEPGQLRPIKEYGQDLESILGAIMLENGISIQDVPHESKFQSLATFMKRYGTVKVEAGKISGYVDELDAAMKQFTVHIPCGLYSHKLRSIERKLETMDAKLPVANLDIVTVEVKLRPRPRVVPSFIGREDILEAMRHAHFNDFPSQQQVPVIIILSGIGGLGKTQIALRFALEFEEKYVTFILQVPPP